MNETSNTQTIREVAKLVKRSWPTRANEKETYTEDQMIEAWNLGVAQGGKLATDIESDTFRQELEKNVKYAAEIRNGLIGYLRGKGLKAHKVYLNVQSCDSLKILFAVPEEDYCTENFLLVLNDAQAREKEASGEALELSIQFMPGAKELDEEQLTADGYIWPQDLASV